MRSILTCLCLILTAISSAAQDWPADELSRTAIARNQQTFARLKPCALEMTWKRDPADQKPATALLKYKGTAVFADSQTLKEAMDGYRKSFACVAQEITDDSGRLVVRMKVYPNKDSSPSDARWAYDFDPACGYAITRLAAMSGSKPFIENKVELQPGELPGTWLPRHIWRYAYTPNTHGEQFEVKILPGADLSEAAFRITALNLPPNQTLARMPPDGAPGSSVVQMDGVWQPDRYSGRLGATVRTAPRVGAVGPKWPALLAAVIFVAAVASFIWTAGSIRRAQNKSGRQ